MSDKKYTPGPWRMEIDTNPDANWANQWPVILSESTGDEIVGTEGFYSDLDSDIANAMLASCAPELLEILEELIENASFDQNCYPLGGCMECAGIDKETSNLINKASAIIAKAKGESQ